MSHADQPASSFSRRDALKTAGAVGAFASLALPRDAHAETPSNDAIRVGLIGAGGRGTGALQQTLSVPGSNVKLTAIADAFDDRIKGALKAVEKMEGKVECPEERQFKGLDGYQKVLDHCDLVILATPPGFRPFHFEAAVKAGKHVFMEKPVCVDSGGMTSGIARRSPRSATGSSATSSGARSIGTPARSGIATASPT
jgi:myo-inositol 2-dehydrogenase/D-chiro-inositol 1-dehydrogenase